MSNKPSLHSMDPYTVGGRERLANLREADVWALRASFGVSLYKVVSGSWARAVLLTVWAFGMYFVMVDRPGQGTTVADAWAWFERVMVGVLMLPVAGFFAAGVHRLLHDPVQGLEPLKTHPELVDQVVRAVESFPSVRRYRDAVLTQGQREFIVMDARAVEALVRDAEDAAEHRRQVAAMAALRERSPAAPE